MKKLLLLIFILFLFACYLTIQEPETVFVVDSIQNSSIYPNCGLRILLRRIPFIANEANEIYYYTNDYVIKVGDKFKLTKVSE